MRVLARIPRLGCGSSCVLIGPPCYNELRHDAIMEQDLDVKSVAHLFNVSDKAVYKWIRQGKVDYYETPGGSYRIPSAQFRDILERKGQLGRAFRRLDE